MLIDFQYTILKMSKLALVVAVASFFSFFLAKKDTTEDTTL